jgi:hypothetical protein
MNNFFSKQEVELFLEQNILKINFLDTQHDPVIVKLLKKLRKYDDKINFKRVFKIAKLIQTKKILLKENYLSLLESSSKYFNESKSTKIMYKKNMGSFFFMLSRVVVKQIIALLKHPKEEKMWEIIKENKKKKKVTLVYIDDKTTVKWLIWQAKQL